MAARRQNEVLCPQSSERFLSLDDEAFNRAAAEAIERLTASSSLDAKRIYDDEVFPLEMERIRREAVKRGAVLELLFVTVGAQASSPTLAILASPAQFVVLLHTNQERESAEKTIQEFGLDAAESALELIGDGKDPAALYRAVFEVWTKRGKPTKVGVDITGGLKPMSAAGAAAAFAIPRCHAYYVDSDQLRPYGWVRLRRIELANPFQVFGEIRRATGRELLKERHYAAAATVYEELFKAAGEEPSDRSRAELAKAYDALDRLDFKTAAESLEALYRRLENFAHDPREQDDSVVRQRGRVSANAEGARRLVTLVALAGRDAPERSCEALRSRDCLELGAMLLARAEHAAPDVAALLSYRCLELVSQRRLAVLGEIDPGAVGWAKLAAKCGLPLSDLIAKYNAKKKKDQLDPKNLPSEISSAVGYSLLAVGWPDDVASAMPTDRFAGLGSARNHSLLAHGLQQAPPNSVTAIRDGARMLFNKLLDVENVSAAEREALNLRHKFVEVE